VGGGARKCHVMTSLKLVKCAFIIVALVDQTP